jgi:hypothetical protein
MATATPWHKRPNGRKQVCMSASKIRIYELFPLWRGGFSVKTIDYDGTTLTVAATSVRQAYALAYKESWIDPVDIDLVGIHLVGIVSIERRTSGIKLWCGCHGHNLTGGYVPHGAGITALRKAIEAHQCPRRVPSLRDRLLAFAAPKQGG